MTDAQRYVSSEFMGLAPNCTAVHPDVSECEFVLASDYDALRAEVEHLRAANIGLATESHELQQEIERLRADAERYRWLRDNLNTLFDKRDMAPQLVWMDAGMLDDDEWQGALDAAIDAERAALAPGEVHAND